jgi:hypothetical protein
MLKMQLTPSASPSISGVIPDFRHDFKIAYEVRPEPTRPGKADQDLLRCWSCGAVIGERKYNTFLVSSNKVEIGGIPLVAGIWRRCRGGKSNPACRALNTLPLDWIKEPTPLIN